jgi:predicted nucleotidyltransferase
MRAARRTFDSITVPNMPAPSLDTTRLREVASRIPALDLLLLFGSRARGDAGPQSDWDFGYIARPGADVTGLLAGLVEATGSDRVDLADLERAGGLLRFRAAQDGVVIVEARPGIADAFRLEAARFWCDAEPVLQRGYRETLEGLGS